MSLVAKLLPVANVLPDLAASSKKRLFEQVGLLFENQHGVGRTTVFESLFARERLGSTGLGQGEQAFPGDRKSTRLNSSH